MNSQSIHKWQEVAEIKETQDSVDIFMRCGGGVIVRNRAFASEADRTRFIELAKIRPVAATKSSDL